MLVLSFPRPEKELDVQKGKTKRAGLVMAIVCIEHFCSCLERPRAAKCGDVGTDHWFHVPEWEVPPRNVWVFYEVSNQDTEELSSHPAILGLGQEELAIEPRSDW